MLIWVTPISCNLEMSKMNIKIGGCFVAGVEKDDVVGLESGKGVGLVIGVYLEFGGL